MLGQHPDVFCGGEILWVDRALAEGKSCSCGQPFDKCPVWSVGLPALGTRGQRNFLRIKARDLERLRAAVGRPLMLDLSKTRAWRLTRWWWKRREGYLLLLRDSRGVLAGAKRKGQSLGEVLPRHRKWMLRWDR